MFGAAAAFALYLALGVPGSVSGADAAPQNVVVVHQFEATTPATAALSRGLHAVLGRTGVAVTEEYLDLTRSPGPADQGEVARWLAAKYRGKRIDLVVADGANALSFLLEQRAGLWKDVPLVFCAVFSNLTPPRELPAGVTGRTVKLPVRENLELALRLFPNMRHVIFLAGSSAVDRALARGFWEVIREFDQRLTVTDLSGTTYEEMKERMRSASQDSFAFGVSLLRDGAGRQFTGPGFFEAVSGESRIPLFAVTTTVLGHGLLGGELLDFQEIGRDAGVLALRVLGGQPPSTIPVSEASTTLRAFDARQLSKFHVERELLPPGSDILFEPPPPVYARRPFIIAMLVAVALEAMLIASLLLEHRRRHRLERERRENQRQIAHMNRIAVVSELAATLAHEVATPVAAMLNDARAARRFMEGPVTRVGDARASLEAIEEQGRRARDVLLQMRRALRRDPVAPSTTDLSEAVRDAVGLVQGDAREHKVSIEAAFPAAGPLVSCDAIQLQQVLLNLLLNAVDAVRDEPPDMRRVRIDVQPGPEKAEVVVRDWGKGLSREQRDHLFEPFFTTKPTGLGMGLSISRSIIEAHGGRIGTHPNVERGAAFSFTLPLASASAPGRVLEAV